MSKVMADMALHVNDIRISIGVERLPLQQHVRIFHHAHRRLRSPGPGGQVLLDLTARDLHDNGDGRIPPRSPNVVGRLLCGFGGLPGFWFIPQVVSRSARSHSMVCRYGLRTLVGFDSFPPPPGHRSLHLAGCNRGVDGGQRFAVEALPLAKVYRQSPA